jgi:predicted transcriptional regulator
MDSQTIRVSKATRDILRDLAAKAQTTMAAIAEEAVKEYEQKKFWENYYAGYNALRADPIAWAEYQDEINLWETTSADGLED